ANGILFGWIMFITMKHEMKQRYRAFRRGWGTYYYEDLVTKKQQSLHTRAQDEAFRLVAAKNQTDKARGVQSASGASLLEGGRSGWRDPHLAARHGGNSQAQKGGHPPPLADRH